MLNETFSCDFQTLWNFQKLAKIDHFWSFWCTFVQSRDVNVARFARNVEWDFFLWFSNTLKFSNFPYSFFRPVFSNPKSIQASVTLLEKLPVILDKSSEDDMRHFVLPLLFDSLESKMSQIQVCTYRNNKYSQWFKNVSNA